MNEWAFGGFVVGATIIAYVLVGYPMLLALLVRIRGPHPPTRGPIRPSVSVVLPVKNGARWIGPKLDSILDLEYPHELMHILVIDDGSTDGTAEIARRYAGRSVSVLAGTGRGKASAINVALQKATGDVLFFTDVRQRLDPQALRVLVEYFADPQVGVVSGELIIMEGSSQQEAAIGLYWRVEKWIRKKLSALHSVPGATGCIYAMRRNLARPLPEDMLVDDMYLPLAAHLCGYRVVFAADARAYDYPTDLDAEFARKVRTLAGNYQIVRALPRLLLPTCPVWLHFVSHKLGRLMLPFALLLVAVCTPWLERPLRVPALVVQGGLYGLAACDPFVGGGSPLKRLSSAARTFLTLMLAALLAPAVMMWGPRRLWKSTVVREAAGR